MNSELDKLKQRKINEIKGLHHKELSQGFNSDASGDKMYYPYDNETQAIFSKLLLSKASGVVTYPVPVFTMENKGVKLTEEQLQKLLQDMSLWEWGLECKLHELITKINLTQTEDEIKTIVW